MTVNVDGSGPVKISLDAMMDIAAANPLAKTFTAARGNAVHVDASNVDHLGAQCAQVLMSASATWRVDGNAFEILDQTTAFQDGARLLGLATFFSREI